MIAKIPVARSSSVRVLFKLPNTTQADRISVVGEFNDWDSTATPMLRCRPDADWTAQVDLPLGRRYRFRYLLDGKKWLNDWYADDYEDNAYGTNDSVVDLTGVGSAPYP